MTPTEVWKLVSPVIPLPDNPNDRGYHMWIEAYTTIYIALKELEEKEKLDEK